MGSPAINTSSAPADTASSPVVPARKKTVTKQKVSGPVRPPKFQISPELQQRRTSTTRSFLKLPKFLKLMPTAVKMIATGRNDKVRFDHSIIPNPSSIPHACDVVDLARKTASYRRTHAKSFQPLLPYIKRKNVLAAKQVEQEKKAFAKTITELEKQDALQGYQAYLDSQSRPNRLAFFRPRLPTRTFQEWRSGGLSSEDIALNNRRSPIEKLREDLRYLANPHSLGATKPAYLEWKKRRLMEVYGPTVLSSPFLNVDPQLLKNLKQFKI